MNSYKNKEVKKYFAVFTIAAAVLVVLAAIIINVELRHYRNLENRAVGALIAEVVEKYPEVDTVELIRILNSSDKIEIEQQMLTEYGITDEYAIKLMESQKTVILVTVLGLVAVIAVSFIIISILYLKKRQKKINELSHYINMLEKGSYQVDFTDNSEDELSNLKNELYKISVELKQSAKTAVENREKLSESVSDISHQLKTPLASVTILLDNMISNENIPYEKRQQFLMEIDRQITQINWMAATMLKISRLEAGVVEFEKSEISLNEIFEEIRESLAIIAEVKNVTIDIKTTDDIKLKGDKNWIREALSNVVKNAIEHSYETTKVIVMAETNDVYTKVVVTNQGDTIDVEDQRHIFERFYKAKGAEKNSNGIGLSLAKSIIEQQNGYITVESKDNITSFTIKFLKVTK